MEKCQKILQEIWNTHHLVIEMITSETPYKLAEIIRDTWPNLYRPVKKSYNTKSKKDKNV